MNKKYYLGIIIFAALFVTGVSLVFAQSWVPPAGPPEGNNVEPPINVSNVSQTKSGAFWSNPLSSLGGLYVAGDVEFPGVLTTSSNTRILTVDTSGNVKWRAAGSWAGGGGLPSDLRLKKNIKPFSSSVLSRLTELQTVSFEWKDGSRGEGKNLGLIAQDVEKVFPEVVKENGEGYKTIDYFGLTATLIEALKEQQEQIDDLKAELQALKKN